MNALKLKLTKLLPLDLAINDDYILWADTNEPVGDHEWLEICYRIRENMCHNTLNCYLDNLSLVVLGIEYDSIPYELRCKLVQTSWEEQGKAIVKTLGEYCTQAN